MRRVWLLETLQRVVTTIYELDDVENSLPEVARTIYEQFGMVSVGIGVLEDGWIHYRGVASRVSTMRNRVPVVPFDAHSSATFPLEAHAGEDLEGDSSVSDTDAIERSAKVPIRIGGEVFGVLSVAVNVESRLTGEELEVLEQIAAVLGSAIEQSRRRALQLGEVELVTRLHDILTQIQDHIDTRDSSDDVLAEIGTAFGYASVHLGWIDRHEIRMYTSYRNAFRRLPPDSVVQVRLGIEGRAARTGRTQFVRDVSQDADYLPVDDCTVALICAPVWSLDEVIGVLRVTSDAAGILSEADLEIVHKLADRFGLVLANLNRLDELERRAEQIRILERLTSTIGRMVPTRASIADVVRELQSVWGEQSEIALVSDNRLFFHGPDPKRMTSEPAWIRDGLPVETGITGRVVRSGEPEFVREVSADPDYVEHGRATGSAIVVPIKVDQQTIGVLNVESTIDRTLDEIDFETLIIVGNHLGIALANYHAFSSEQSARTGLEAVQRVSSIVSQTLDPDEALRLIAETLAAVLHYPIVAVEVISESSLRLAASFGFAPGAYERRPMDSGMAGRAIQEGEIEFVPDLAAAAPGQAFRDDAMSGVYVPIRTGTTITGVLTVQGTRERMLTDWDVNILRTFAENVGVLLANTQTYDEMRSSASLDSITGVANHRFFQQRLRQVIEQARRSDQELSLLVIDIDSFKDLNDRFGHIEGDHVLVEIAKRLNSQLRGEDLLARYAGDEFVVVLPGVNMRVSLEIAARLLRSVRSRPFEMSNGETVVVTLSIGAATYPEDATSDEELIGAADTAMYLAKGYGRDAVCHFRDVALLDSGRQRDPIVRIDP
jgi:diguanylate cyclase (GGDEF)-like protein